MSTVPFVHTVDGKKIVMGEAEVFRDEEGVGVKVKLNEEGHKFFRSTVDPKRQCFSLGPYSLGTVEPS